MKNFLNLFLFSIKTQNYRKTGISKILSYLQDIDKKHNA